VVDNGAPNFDYCLIAVRTKGTRIEGEVGYLEDKASISEVDRTEDRQRKPARGLKVQRGEESNDACERFLQFADDVWLTITAVNYNDDEGDWCPFADAMVDMVIARLGSAPVRRLPFEQNSVGALSACELIKPDAVAAKLGAARLEEHRYPSGHACEWTGSGHGGPRARLTFDVQPADGDGADLSTCLVETEHIDSIVFHSAELVDVQVGVPGTGKDACAPAREIAKEVWAKLPKS
jgi:hypothetical protein